MEPKAAAATATPLAEIAAQMRDCDDFIICGHVSPDGDCLGSQLALRDALARLGKRAVCVLAKSDPVPPIFDFLPGADGLVPAGRYRGPAATFVAVDVSVRDRLGEGAALMDRCRTVFTIDHHQSDGSLGGVGHIDPDAPSASLLVWQLAGHLAGEPSADCALCAYTGLATDTGGFRFQNSTAAAFEGAAEMVCAGARPDLVATEVFQNRTRPSLDLEALVIERMQVFGDGQGVISWVTLDDMRRCGAVKSDTEPLIDAIRSLTGVRVACILREQENSIRGSLRAKDDTDVASLARTLDGGGHRAAAGFTLRKPIDRAVPFMQERITALLEGETQARNGIVE